MAEEIDKKQATKNDNVIHVRLSDRTGEDVAKFAKDVYGFRTTSEFMRYVLDYVFENRPVLGKAFAPES